MAQQVSFIADGQFQFALKYIEKALRGRGAERATRRKLPRHLREPGAELRRYMNHELDSGGAGQRRADEGVRRLQQVIRPQAASSCSQMMQS